MPRRPRQLSREDREIWDRISRQVKPLRGDETVQFPPRKRPLPSRPAPAEVEAPPPFDLTREVPSARRPQTRIDLVPDPMHALAEQSPRMDSKTHRRLTRGKLSPDARLDLHGMTAERAHATLRSFLLGAHDRGSRLVLVITGKGRGGPEDPHDLPARRGVLRNAVPRWLAQPPLAGLVLDIAPAHQRHGGGGAYYIYLRRRR